MKYCKRCGRQLKNPESIELGYGPVCYKKMLLSKRGQRLVEIVENQVKKSFKKDENKC